MLMVQPDKDPMFSVTGTDELLVEALFVVLAKDGSSEGAVVELV